MSNTDARPVDERSAIFGVPDAVAVGTLCGAIGPFSLLMLSCGLMMLRVAPRSPRSA